MEEISPIKEILYSEIKKISEKKENGIRNNNYWRKNIPDKIWV